MTDLDESALREAENRGEVLVVEEFVALVERHDDDGPGVPRDRVVEYAEALDERASGRIDVDDVEDALAERLTDDEEWAGEDALYEVRPGRVSRYPPAWHEGFADADDLRETVEFLVDALPEDGRGLSRGGAGEGVPETLLLDARATLRDVSYGDAEAELEELRDADELAQDADQHPNARVRPA